jgi:glyoxylase-like metal-dependent hydrolase (beta-lactamase superfamily II)
MIPFVRDIRFEYGVPEQVSPLIRRVVANNPSPFSYLGTGTYIVGRGEVAVIDPGPALPAHLDAILATIAGETVKAILVTHNHSDHSPLARPLAQRTGAATYGCPMAHAPVQPSLVVDDEHDAAFVADINICGGGLIEGPGWTLEAIPTPGHTSNHICYALLEENALFSGDHIMGWSTTVVAPPDGDMGAYLQSLLTIRTRGFSTLWPTHGPPITDPGPFIDAYRDHRLDREAQILAQLAQGRRRIPDMVPMMYAAVDPKLHPAAALSVLAHMIHLVRSGRVRSSDGEPGLGSEYRLA